MTADTAVPATFRRGTRLPDEGDDELPDADWLV